MLFQRAGVPGLGQRQPGGLGQEVRAARRHLLRVFVRGLHLHVGPRPAQDELKFSAGGCAECKVERSFWGAVDLV